MTRNKKRDYRLLFTVTLYHIELITTGSNIVWRERLKELDREDARKRPVVIVLRMTWKV